MNSFGQQQEKSTRVTGRKVGPTSGHQEIKV
jgi:hypothetical protein